MLAMMKAPSGERMRKTAVQLERKLIITVVHARTHTHTNTHKVLSKCVEKWLAVNT
jgi:hypothetical protein